MFAALELPQGPYGREDCILCLIDFSLPLSGLHDLRCDFASC